ncbi:hypothetical protein EDB81DRAFT_61153 [Dactylonectria macrodidyma]|uniref:Rhodopsin domain-containing protein n=1 Tax=Dactylonectria macrodidyma TaxID=307937 RepID=A0A9P9EJH7_9HYPO|nr:hypothetical protein EDB81DRAFT_61153 [Dactylonectria macrodidyma]
MTTNTTTSEAEAAAAAAAAAMAALRRFNIEAFTLLAIALLITGLRCVIRIRTVGFKHLWADDYLAVVAALAYSAETALAYSVGNIARGLANNSMTDAQRAALDPNSEEYELRILGSKIQLAGWSTYSFLLWVLKACMCTFYYRLTKDLDGYRSKIYFGFGFIITSWVAVQLNILLSCRPSFSMWWQIHPDPGEYCHPAISPAIVWTGLALNVATDLYLIMIPMPMLWKAAMPWMQKCWLIALFSCGLFVTMAAILRVVLLMADPVNGAMLAGSWAVRETFTAVVTTNIPMLFPHFKKVVGPIVSRVGSSLGFSRNSKSGGGTLDTWKRKSSRHGSIPLPGNSMSGDGRGDDESETYMVDLPERNKTATSTKKTHGGPVGVQRDIEVSVFELNHDRQQEQPQQLQRTYTQNGNYTATWSSSQSSVPRSAEQSNYYLGHVHQSGYSNRN